MMKISSLLILCTISRWDMTHSFSAVPNDPGASSAFSPFSSTPPNKNTNWNINSMVNVMRVEGMSRRTWDFSDLTKDTVQVVLESNGRPVAADVQVWIGPDWTPFKVTAYSEDGQLRPIQALVGTRSKVAQIEVRNTNSMEYPFSASCEYAKPPENTIRKVMPTMLTPRYVEGGAVYQVPFDSEADQIQVYLETDARQMNAKIELLNGMFYDYSIFIMLLLLLRLL